MKYNERPGQDARIEFADHALLEDKLHANDNEIYRPKDLDYSAPARIASNGATLDARNAGTRPAAAAIRAMITAAPPKVSGSCVLTPNTSEAMSLVSMLAARSPTKIPIPATRPASSITILTTRWRCAPIAIRMPISRVRCVTPYDITPYTPAA